MSDEKIDSYVDRAAFGADTDFIESELKRVTDLFDKVNNIKVSLQGATSLKDVSTAATAAQGGMTDLSAATERAVQKMAQYNGSSKEISQLILLEARAAKELAAAKALEAEATLKSAQAKAVEEKAARDSQATSGKEASAQKETTEAIKDQASAQQEKTILQREVDKATFEGKLNQQLYNKELKDEVALENTATGSINEMRLQIKQLTKDRNELNLTTNEGRAANADFNKQIDKLNDAITAGSAGLERRKINIGNYTGAVSILNDALIQSKAKLDQMTSSERTNTEAGQQLTKTVELLTILSAQQSHGFTSLTTELRASERALRTMFEAGLAGTPAFEELQTVVNDTTRRVREFGREQTLLSSESPALAGLTAAARGLGGAYAVGAGAAALFADGNEKVEKELNKLVAIMTFLQGLTEFNRFLQEKEAIAKSLNAVKTTFLAAAQNLVALATGKASAATTAQIIAETAAIQPAEALAEAQSVVAATNEEIAATGAAAGESLAAEAIGADGLAIGLGGVEAAEAGVAVGATTMSTAIAATGIGLLIVGLAVAIYKIVEAVKDWNAASESITKANEEVIKSLKDLIEATKHYDDLNRESTTRQLTDLDRLIAKRKALGVNSVEALALDKKIADARLKASEDEVRLNDITAESIAKQNADVVNAAGLVKANEERKQAYLKKTGKTVQDNAEALSLLNKLQNGEVELTFENARKLSVLGDKDFVKKIKQFDDLGKKYKEDLEAKDAAYKNDSENFERNETNKQQAGLVTNQIVTLDASERRKLILESSKIEANIIKSKNDLILSNERSSLAQRISAIKSNAKEERAIITANLNNTLTDPNTTDTDKDIARKQANANRIKVTDDTERAVFDIKEVYRKKDLQAQLDIDKTKLQADKDFQERSISDQFSALQNNIEALTQAGEDQKQMITDDYEFAKATQILTEKQRLALDAAYQQKLVDSDRDTQDKIRAQQEKAIADYVTFLQKKQQARLDQKNNKIDIADNEDAIKLINRAEIDEANATAGKRVKIEKKLQQDLSIVDKEAQLDKLQIEENGLLHELANALLIEAPTLDIEKKITDNKRKQAALRKGISDDEYNNEKQNRIARLEEEKAYATDVVDAYQSIQDGQYDIQKNNIQKQQDLNDAKEQRDIDAVNASTRSEQDKAAAITIIQARADAEKQALDLKQRKADYEKAKFDKQVDILKTVGAIAVDIAEGNFIAAAAAGVALIKLIATPVPHYKHGKNKKDNYEGPAIWGDGGKSEMKVSQDGRIEISPTRPTLTHVKADDIILPDINHVEFLTGNILRSHQGFAEKARGYNPNENNSRELAELKAEVRSMKNAVVNSIKNKKELHLRPGYNNLLAIQQYGANQIKYVHDNTQF